jgi:hypothetical protein
MTPTRFRVLFAALLVLCLGLAVSAQRDTTTSPSDLARFAPAEAFLFGATRIDTATLETLDGLINRIGTASGFPVQDGLQAAIRTMDIDGWAGEAIAAYTPRPKSLDDDPTPRTVVLLEVANRGEAFTFLTQALGEAVTDPSTRFSTFTNPSNGQTFVLTNDLLAFANSADDLADAPLNGDGASLATDLGYQRAVGSLPAPDYAAIAYFDPAALFPLIGDEIKQLLPMVDVVALADWFGGFAFGLTQFDGRAFAFDLSWEHNGSEALSQALGLSQTVEFFPTFDPIDPAFLENVPAGTQLVVQGGGAWRNLVTTARATSQTLTDLRQQADLPILIDPMGVGDINTGFLAAQLLANQIGNGIAVLTLKGGLGLTDAQLIDALDGQSILGWRLGTNEQRSNLSIEPALWLESQGNGSRDLLGGVSGWLDEFMLERAQTDDGFSFSVDWQALTRNFDAEALVLPNTFVWRATDSLTFFGADTLLPSDRTDSIAPRVAEISPYLLEGASGLAWIDLQGVATLVAGLDSTADAVLAEFDSLFASVVQTQTGTQARFAFVLK